jgi:hypothetical protein
LHLGYLVALEHEGRREDHKLIHLGIDPVHAQLCWVYKSHVGAAGAQKGFLSQASDTS